MAFTPYTKEQALAAGFALLPGTQNESLFLHTRYPGFLFKLVTTLDQCIACGAAMVRTANEQVSYFGLDLVYVVKDGKFGRYGRPGSIRKSRNALSTIALYYGKGNTTDEASTGARFDQETTQWTDDPVDGKYIGIISRADRGLIVDREWKAGLADVQLVVDVLQDKVYSGNPGQGWVGWSPDLKATVSLASLSGFISNHIPLVKKRFLQQARAGFLGSIEADSKIVSAYVKAYDEHLASLGDDEVVTDSMTVFPYSAGQGQPIVFSSERRYQEPWNHGMYYSNGDEEIADDAQAQASGNGQSPWNMMRVNEVKEITDSNGATTYPETIAYRTADFRGMTVVVSLPHEQTIAGVPYPFWVMIGVGSGATADGSIPSKWIGTSGSRRIAAVGRTFPLDAVPFKGVKMIADAELPSASLYAAFGPRVRPDSLEDAVDVLDLAERVNIEVASVTGIPALPAAVAPGANDTEREIAAGSLDAKLAEREAATLAACKHLTPMTAFITESVAAITSRARRNLKG